MLPPFLLEAPTEKLVHCCTIVSEHLCFWEAVRRILYNGNFIYRGTLYANYPSTDLQAFLRSLKKVATLPIRQILPGHHDLQLASDLAVQMRDSLQALQTAGMLHHGSGLHSFEGWSILL